MGSTICYDLLINQAKNKKIKSNAEPGQEDPEFDQKVEEEKEKYQAQADAIYDAETKKIKLKIKAKKALIIASEPIKTAEYAQERFNSTDIEKYGENGIKTSIQKELQALSLGIDDMLEKSDIKIDELKNKLDEKAKEKLEKKLAEKEKKAKERKKTKTKNRQEKEKKKKKPAKKVSSDLINEASKIGKETDKEIDIFEAEQEAILEDIEKNIEQISKENGEIRGAKMVDIYNKAIKKAAKVQHELIQKNLVKAKIKADQTIQSAKLKILAKLGIK